MFNKYTKEKRQNWFLENLLINDFATNIDLYAKTHNITRSEVIQLYTVIKENKKNLLANDADGNFSIAKGKKALVRDFLDEGGFVKIKIKEDSEFWNSRLSIWVSIAALIISIFALFK